MALLFFGGGPQRYTSPRTTYLEIRKMTIAAQNAAIRAKFEARALAHYFGRRTVSTEQAKAALLARNGDNYQRQEVQHLWNNFCQVIDAGATRH